MKRMGSMISEGDQAGAVEETQPSTIEGAEAGAEEGPQAGAVDGEQSGDVEREKSLTLKEILLSLCRGSLTEQRERLSARRKC